MNWKTWTYSLISAAIGGAANSLGGFIVAPDVFNFSHSGIQKLGALALFGAAVPVLTLLKQSPLPALTATTTVTTTATQETTVQPK
jgi:hypothetical protein